MREIKFRAWDTTANEMFSPADSGVTVEELQDPQWRKIYSLMQFTGLLDKNGVEIFQGDYVLVKSDKENYGSVSYGGIIEVTALTCGYQFKLLKPTLQEMEDRGEPWDSTSLWHIDEPANLEVIGNIYENPELIK